MKTDRANKPNKASLENADKYDREKYGGGIDMNRDLVLVCLVIEYNLQGRVKVPTGGNAAKAVSPRA